MWMATRSSYRVTAQKPALGPDSGCHTTGASCRRRLNHSNGTPVTKLAGLARSLSLRTAVTNAQSEERDVVLQLPLRRVGGRRVVDRLGVALPLGELQLGEGIDEWCAERVAQPFVSLHRLDGLLEGRGNMRAGRLRRDGLCVGHRHLFFDTEPAGVQELRRREVRVARPVRHAVLEPGGVTAIGT